MLNASLAYKKSVIETLSKEDILVKLLEGGLLYLKQAIKFWSDGKKDKARELRSRAAAILIELDSSLDRDNGEKEIVEQLDALYGYMIKEMNEAVVADDFDRLKNIEEVWEKIYDGFKEAAKIFKQQTKGKTP